MNTAKHPIARSGTSSPTKQARRASNSSTVLKQLVRKIRAALRRETTNKIEIGQFLIESREHLEHGEWLPWLEQNFNLSERTAQRYIAAFTYVASKAKSDTMSDFTKSDAVSGFANLAPGVLYALAAGQYNEQEEAAIWAAARERHIDPDAVADTPPSTT
jgi:hypothetical protein